MFSMILCYRQLLKVGTETAKVLNRRRIRIQRPNSTCERAVAVGPTRSNARGTERVREECTEPMRKFALSLSTRGHP